MQNDKFIGGGVVDEEESLVAECFHGFEYVVGLNDWFSGNETCKQIDDCSIDSGFTQDNPCSFNYTGALSVGTFGEFAFPTERCEQVGLSATLAG